MSWEVGYDPAWKRDIGYGVPAVCDHPGCGATINRGLGHVCGGEPYGGEYGCGLYFCARHGGGGQCVRCAAGGKCFEPTADVADWVSHKLTDPSWKAWRIENPADVVALLAVRPGASND
ncbi:hypothetical protein [Stenotrophomonas lacuserhaii]|uniref:hypothetical protein n=1 Tax=Stenotrophomonas lacuserhaii TaxID=2760084 RepID=UPI0015FB186C|nr:hypothetical protein [Stenotrophomonas lacuserhaii]